MNQYPIVLSIAGSDSTGGAGIQADIRTISALEAYPTTVITAIAVQQRNGINAIHDIPVSIIRNQIEFIMENMWPDVVKIGLIPNVEAAKVIADCLRKYHPQYVVFDPVILTLNDGTNTLDELTLKVIKDELLHYTNLMTISLTEAEVFTGLKITTVNDLKETAQILAEKYRIPVLVKGANLLGDNTYDILYIPNGEKWEYIGNRVKTENIHSLSTIFSSATATYLAHGTNPNLAVKTAREYIEKLIITDTEEAVADNISSDSVRMQIYSSEGVK